MPGRSLCGPNPRRALRGSRALSHSWAKAMRCSLLPCRGPAGPYLLALPAGPALPAAAAHPAAEEPAPGLVPPAPPSAADCFRVQGPPTRIRAPPRPGGANEGRGPAHAPPPNTWRGGRHRPRPLALPARGRYVLPPP